MVSTSYDVIIIGTGAGGGTLLHALADTGRRILVLERGGYVPREPQNWNPQEVNALGRYHTKEVWKTKGAKDLHPHTNYYVGGNTKFYGAALFRLRREDFGEIQHHGGVSPAWPISYQDLEPYYLRAENLYQVHGNRGEDPTEAPASGPYPWPAVSHEPRIQALCDAWEKLGHQPFHVPLGVQLNEREPHKSACIRCATCDGFPCLVNAKSDSHIMAVLPALERPNVTLLAQAKVVRLDTDVSGTRVESVAVERDGQIERYTADLVVISAGAVNSAALLLRSANPRHPKGLANSSGQVGRHYMGHLNSIVLAISRHPNPTVFQKTLALNDFYFKSEDFPFPLGHISFVGKLDAHTMAAGAPALAPGMTLEFMARHSLDFWLTSEDLPDPENRVGLDGQGNIVLSYQPNNQEGHLRLLAKLKELVRKADMDFVPLNLFLGERIPLAGVAHQNGTLRFGHDPKTSVLDLNCRAHDLDNLYVVDASFFPSSAAVNPGLTVMANALRVGDHLRTRLGKA